MTASATRSIPAWIDDAPLGAFQIRVLALCVLIALLDGFDTQAIAFTGPAILASFALPAGALAPILTAGIVGMTIGAMTLGLVGDRIGRRPAIMIGLALFGAATLATAWASSPSQILVLRFIAGLGMGGCTPVLLALAAEYCPARLRGAVMTGVLLGLPAGAMLGGLLAARMLPAIGWQGIFVVGGGVPLAMLGAVALLLPESLCYLASRDDARAQQRVRATLSKIAMQPLPADARFTVPDEASAKASVGALFRNGYARRTLGIWAIYLLNWIAWFMLLSWLPTVLKAAGLTAQQAPVGTVIVNAVFIVCAIPLSIVLPRVNVRNLLCAMFAFGIAVALALGQAGTNWTLVFVLVGAAGFGIGGQQIALNYLIVGAYPTALRATATGWAIGMGRAGAIAGSAIGGTFLAWGGAPGFFTALAVPLAGAALAAFGLRLGRTPGADLAAANR
ncbi:MFS transporter [Burkholderia multivorans]|jgi:AAHS family 4-hydroxybenzoate transporter-like MFS transporter|uniref:Major facilitator superfamily MFS_1 n=1 Tax=Burkholderia multivorans CGD2 TaxID=513052 RepID=B9BYL4_9BURK|nr:MFS transporter [Burkholderia multivorans]EEE04085.1 major facilitator superfamily MFS_1 [Burkholderia multivorans CGD2]EEE11602.1 major facilitator superfamily MFS_1 [Burkholderia multivorans CGD2M]MBU9488414.1 MFS transporter [Burkholderia multivorans]